MAQVDDHGNLFQVDAFAGIIGTSHDEDTWTRSARTCRKGGGVSGSGCANYIAFVAMLTVTVAFEPSIICYV